LTVVTEARVLVSVDDALCEAFAVTPTRASTSFLGVEPIEVLRFVVSDISSYVTLGMSRRPMTSSTAEIVSADGPRAELMMQSWGDGGDVWRRLTVLAAAPAVEGIVYNDGMTVDLGVALTAESICTGGVIVASAVPAIETPMGAVQVLRVMPATSSELAWSRVHGSAALRARWERLGTDLLDLARAGVDLSQ
jgi:hypothetical protein